MPSKVTRLSRPGRRVSPTLIVSYLSDWITLILAAIVGGLLSRISPNKRPFSVLDPSLGFPFVQHEKISLTTLTLSAMLAPALIIFAVSIFLVPGPTAHKSTPRALIWRRRLWEWHTGWLGLALSLATAFLITNGMKNLFGKPRPDLIARCNPDYANIDKYALIPSHLTTQGDYFLVNADICLNTNKSVMDDGFRSYPSGHSSFSAAGLIYLSLFLAAKFAITVPFIAPKPSGEGSSSISSSAHLPTRRSASGDPLLEPLAHNNHIIAARNDSAAPPVYLLLIAVIPFFASIYIASTRYSDFRHHGFDILFGYFIGTVAAIFAFRYYHLPISSGAGWSWGPRSHERSFWAGLGMDGYVGRGNVGQTVDLNDESENPDLEAGTNNHNYHDEPSAPSNGSGSRLT